MILTKSRPFLIGLLLGLLLLPAAALADRPLEAEIDAAFKAGELEGLHSVIILHKGKILAERHYAGDDERWGAPLPDRRHGPDTLHDLRSVTKSIVGLLYGIALNDGIVPAPDAPVLAQFPEYADLAGDARRDRILVRHVLSMKMGAEWNEDLPYSNPANSEIAMEHAEDRYRFVLDRPMVAEPGESWTYSGGATALAARLIARGAGKPIDDYAAEKLFEPLGIDAFDWVRGGDGEPSAASGLRLAIGDLARIGQMVLNDGRWQGNQVVPADWLRQSFTAHASHPSGLRYGYFWWLARNGDPPDSVAGFGNGGQRLSVSRKYDWVVAVTAGNYNRPDDWKVPVKILVDFVFPASGVP